MKLTSIIAIYFLFGNLEMFGKYAQSLTPGVETVRLPFRTASRVIRN